MNATHVNQIIRRLNFIPPGLDERDLLEMRDDVARVQRWADELLRKAVAGMAALSEPSATGSTADRTCVRNSVTPLP